MSAGIDFDWSRRIEVYLDGGEPLVATGKMTDYRISAVISKAFRGIPTASRLNIWNLGENTKNRMVRDKTKITIKAGWEKGPRAGMHECFVGELLNATTYRQGSDLITSIGTISSMKALAETKVSRHWPAGKSVDSVFKELGATFPGLLGVETTGIKGNIGERGDDWIGLAKNALDYFGNTFGVSWTIIDGKFQAVGDESNVGKVIEIKDPYLISASPAFSGVQQQQTMVELAWQCTFDHALSPHNMVKIHSKLSNYGGPYRINAIAHLLDCHEQRSFITSGKASTLK